MSPFFENLNLLEQEFVARIAARAELLLAVGDPDQSVCILGLFILTGFWSLAVGEVKTHASFVMGAILAASSNIRTPTSTGGSDRTEFIEAQPGAQEGEVHFIRKQNQVAEFGYVLQSIAARLADGESPSEIIVLASRRKLSRGFSEYTSADVDNDLIHGRSKDPWLEA